MKRDKSAYAISREPYKVLFPDATMHHQHPTSRGGSDGEENLFPWNPVSHSAWHDVFSVMTTQEVFPILAEAHRAIFESQHEMMVREWCLPYCYEVRGDIQGDMLSEKRIAWLREAWFRCFGSSDLRIARRVVRYMMLFMVFGRYAEGGDEVYQDRVLRRLLNGIPRVGHRAWAFEHCFGCGPRHINLPDAKRVIERIRARARGLVVR